MADLRERLQFTYLTNNLPCREKECETIKKYIEQNLRAGIGGTMYISGMPGTGKTACVMQTIQSLEKSKDKILKKFRLILTNGMKIVDPKNLFVAIHSQLFRSKKRISPNSAFINLQKYFDKILVDDDDDERPSILLVIDEIDVLVTKKQTILYRLFDWTTKDSSKLTILAIANTLDLPERMLSHRISSRFGLNRLCFQPYSHSQIEEILQNRLKNCPSLENVALQLIARKVAAVSGDLRRALEICQTAAEFHYEEYKTNKKCKFGLVHAKKALNQIEGGIKVTAVRSSSEHQKLILKSAFAEYRRVGTEEMTVDRLFGHYNDLCRDTGVDPCCREDVVQLIYNLCECRLFIAAAGRQHYRRKIRLNINPEDLSYALKSK